MGWVIVGIIVLLVVARILVSSYDLRQIRGRTRRHLASGGKFSEAPDVMPPHGGGASG